MYARQTLLSDLSSGACRRFRGTNTSIATTEKCGLRVMIKTYQHAWKGKPVGQHTCATTHANYAAVTLTLGQSSRLL